MINCLIGEVARQKEFSNTFCIRTHLDGSRPNAHPLVFDLQPPSALVVVAVRRANQPRAYFWGGHQGTTLKRLQALPVRSAVEFRPTQQAHHERDGLPAVLASQSLRSPSAVVLEAQTAAPWGAALNRTAPPLALLSLTSYRFIQASASRAHNPRGRRG